MPIVDERSSGERENVWVTFQSVSDKIMDKKDGTQELRLVFDVNDADRTVSLGVPINNPQPQLRPFMNASGAPTSESPLRDFIEKGLKETPALFVSAWNNFIQDVIAPPGTYRVTLKDLRRFTRSKDGQERVAIVMQTEDGQETSWTYPWPAMECTLGSTGDLDGFTGFSAEAGLFETLIACGLDWNKWLAEMKAAPRLYNRIGLDGVEEGMLGDNEDITDGLVNTVNRHGSRPVQIEIVDDAEYGIGPKRVKYMVKLTPIIIEGGDPAFAKELEVFGILWDSLTIKVLKKDDSRFLVAGAPGKDGMIVAKGVLLPIVHEWPDLVHLRKKDGTPRLPFPITPVGWRLNGLAVLGFVAKALLALDDEELFKVVNLNDPTGLLEWAEENVPELSDDMDEEVEL